MEREIPIDADRELDFHPGMGMRWEVTQSTDETSGALFESTNWIDPRMPGPPPHVHPSSEESFEVLEGSLDVCIDGECRTLGPGESVTVPPGQAHTLRNASDQPLTTITRIRPAGRSEELFRNMHRLIGEGKLKRLPPKEPGSAICGDALRPMFRRDPRDRTAPRGLKALALTGRALRFKLD